jgi:hypothetical protein
VNGIVTVELSGRDPFTLDTTSLTGSPTSRREAVRSSLQAVFDVRTPLTDLPIDDPDLTTDPRRPGLFWSDSTGNAAAAVKTHLTGRSYTVTIGADLLPSYRRTT